MSAMRDEIAHYLNDYLQIEKIQGLLPQRDASHWPS